MRANKQGCACAQVQTCTAFIVRVHGPKCGFPVTSLSCSTEHIVHCTAHWGAQKLTGENLKPVWAEFSTIS